MIPPTLNQLNWATKAGFRWPNVSRHTDSKGVVFEAKPKAIRGPLDSSQDLRLIYAVQAVHGEYDVTEMSERAILDRCPQLQKS
jgi:hypothetical protein